MMKPSIVSDQSRRAYFGCVGLTASASQGERDIYLFTDVPLTPNAL